MHPRQTQLVYVAGFDMCRRYRMPDNVEPFQPKDGSHRSPQATRDPGLSGRGDSPPFGDPAGPLRYLYSMDSLAWATLGSITRMMQARSGVQSSEFFLKIQA